MFVVRIAMTEEVIIMHIVQVYLGLAVIFVPNEDA